MNWIAKAAERIGKIIEEQAVPLPTDRELAQIIKEEYEKEDGGGVLKA